MQELKAIVGQLAGYGELIVAGLAVIVGGMIAVLLLYRIASSIVKPGGKYARAMKVFFGAIYAMVLVVTILLAAQRIGLPVEGLAGPAILLVLVIAVIFFFIVPFLPRVPFIPGNMVQVKDVIGIVEAITAYQVVIRTFDGQTVFIPTAVVMASPIRNFSTVPQRRVELNVDIQPGDDVERARSLLLEIMAANEKVLAEPPPAVFVTGISGERASLFAFAWVENADWFSTRDALWRALRDAFAGEENVSLALPQLQVSTTKPPTNP
ncbi:mechanosensitive ion channel family protein [Pseudohalioglobus sediminis]|uniref:Small-conductance mechanosensitive channel n=1 Tax=Pseudohalioglobus sediminis TaxID=2606449 RepID=A0A5B0WSM6_9GAMM|nr:mechanosensitive ion channel family protein [Pseudohalioglobus sediminis]KAA1189231.1 mechanosensitive ion channel family protein [Pseudohalioglobus sediminis]